MRHQRFVTRTPRAMAANLPGLSWPFFWGDAFGRFRPIYRFFFGLQDRKGLW